MLPVGGMVGGLDSVLQLIKISSCMNHWRDIMGWDDKCDSQQTPLDDRLNTGLMRRPTYQSTLLASERAERSIGGGSSVRAFPYERPNF